MGVSLRAALAGDREAVVALWEAAGLTRPWNDPRADFDLALATATSAVLLAEQEGAIIASVMVGFDGHRGWVYYLATAPESRLQGIGRRLMRAAEEWLSAIGSPKIQLMVRGDNAGARGFYDALGYELQDVVTIGKRL
ncbi:GNAT family acetyltransferase [Erythrobacter colymbi]|uniref:GNAT family acetyltransferase n=1 Tax=Erythrobacter colymbi TaxID=1161202 RepID=UPI000A38CBA4|nr:GNAT family acetyltransferase [Erythrobacter colymbi]